MVMSRDNRYIIRRTISQERFEVLWKKRKDGRATLRDLTEMDEIINRDAGIRLFVLEEMENPNEPENNHDMQNMLQQPNVSQQTLLSKIKTFFNRLFNFVRTDRQLLQVN